MSGYTLVTGATGLLGRYLLRDLLLEDHRLCLVLRPGRRQSIAERIETILQRSERELGRLLPRPVLFEGDLTQPHMGLDTNAQRWIGNNCSGIIHNAAALTFHGTDRDGEPWRTNVHGTRHVIETCQRLDVCDFHYVSTAYVCGERNGTIREEELEAGQSFRNDYENSKFEAERFVRAADWNKLTVYRPAVIAGDSKTGYTNTYHGLYMYLKLMSILVWNTEPDANGVRHTPVRLNMTGDEPRYIVLLDWVSAVICHVFDSPEAHGRTFHIAPDEPITPREIIAAGYQYFNSTGVEFVGCDSADNDCISEMDANAHDNMSMYESYETSDPHFDTTNLCRFAPHLPCPKINVPMLHRYWRYGEDDRWGKRREPQPQVPFWVEDYLSQIVIPEPFGNGNGRNHVIGLDVRGPGGGQWHFHFSGKQLASVRPGVPENCTAVVYMDVAEFPGWWEQLTGTLDANDRDGVTVANDDDASVLLGMLGNMPLDSPLGNPSEI